MVSTTVAEQQAKLGVSAEESKALRLKRQQARFRDRGGAFIPSTSNPLVDILLARTVSGESPSKACPRDATAKRRSPAKARQTSPTRNARAATVAQESRAVAGSSKSKAPGPGKRKAKAVEPEAERPAKLPPKRRGTARAKKKTPNPGSDTEQHRPSTSNGKGRRRGNVKTKPKPKAKAAAKAAAEVLVSDDDSTLVEVPHKVKSNPKRDTRNEDEESDDDVPIVQKRAKLRGGDSKSSSAKAATGVKTKRTAGAARSKEKISENGEDWTRYEKQPKTTAKKRQVPPDDEGDEAGPPAKKGKASRSTSAKSKTPVESEPVGRPIKGVTKSENSKVTSKGKAEPVEDLAEPAEENDERPLERVSKPNKRKTEEDNYDDRPRKVVKFSETAHSHSSSQKLKENQSERKWESGARSSDKDGLDVPREKLATKTPARAKTPKGPPQEVLKRIKASAARHLQCVDSEPDELDCLS